MARSGQKLLSRRQALRRLGLGVATAYITPSLTTLSAAHAGSNPTPPTAPSEASAPSEPSAPSQPTAPTAPSSPTQPSGPTGGGRNTENSPSGARSASCRVRTVKDDGSFTISRRDFDAAQAAVQSGDAQPLDSVWPRIAEQYRGRLIGIEFTGSGTNARYQFRAISAAGRLETIVVHAATGIIETIVSC